MGRPGQSDGVARPLGGLGGGIDTVARLVGKAAGDGADETGPAFGRGNGGGELARHLDGRGCIERLQHGGELGRELQLFVTGGEPADVGHGGNDARGGGHGGVAVELNLREDRLADEALARVGDFGDELAQMLDDEIGLRPVVGVPGAQPAQCANGGGSQRRGIDAGGVKISDRSLDLGIGAGGDGEFRGVHGVEIGLPLAQRLVGLEELLEGLEAGLRLGGIGVGLDQPRGDFAGE